MQIKNFRFKKIKIYIKNLIFKVNKIIFENESEKKIKEVKYILIEDQYFNQYKNDFNKVKKFLKKNNFEILKIFNFPTFHYRDILFKKKPPEISF